MPRVSEEHLERRRQQILDAARACFTRKGFYETSMQDIFQESGLSAGAVYRYFKSKNDLILAIAAQNQPLVARIIDDLADAAEPPPLDEIMAALARKVISLLGDDGALRVAPQGWAAATYDPYVGEIVQGILLNTRTRFVRLAERLRATGRLAPDADPEAVGATLLCIMPGFVLQRLILGDIDDGTLRAGLRALLGTP
ncbi:TetR/AcrR family transcriptional regulator [Actinomadura craniellae]|uniref:TetR/AcrR family transcriptional regulator n=1 Tax=Actinomadura craniellae TaxID=2231787 RepID=A0A365GYY5_9ACTN|nr:TetR/AcrR family transcriptional regulator [Actinomadura craniellae]RAY12032.1 TetR/AcrR family transcriptional regulator [Actinomadura craniellae]